MVKQFSSYNSNNPASEKEAILAFAKKRNEEYLKKLKSSEEFINKEKLKELENKKQQLLKENELKRVLSIPNEVIQNNIKKAEENNKKFANNFNQFSLTSDIINSIFEKN